LKEKDLKRKCREWLKKNTPPEFYIVWPQDSSHSGIPDALFCARGRFGWAELKVDGGRVAPIQKYTHDKIAGAMGVGRVCWNIEEFIDLIRSFYK
jgi:hypothetical protein